ncbi:MAG: dephospho-CoA kinase [Lachnospiraceae bacterium]
MIKIGITGGVGCGKSRVLEYISRHTSSRILMADDVGHLVKRPGTECYRQLVELLGENILEEEGQIHRGKMAELIFGDKRLLKQVNEIIHPAVRDYILQAMKEEETSGRSDFFFLEAALLIEAGYLVWLDELWYIYSDEESRRKRLKESRQYSDEKIQQMMKNQLTDHEFRKYAGIIIDNSGEFADTCTQLQREIERLQKRRKQA